MGACNIEFTAPGNYSRNQVVEKFREQQSCDAMYNGHQEGYSGDFQTVDEVKFHDVEFTSYREAHDYCLKHAQKWEFVVAVRLKNPSENSWLVAGWGAC